MKDFILDEKSQYQFYQIIEEWINDVEDDSNGEKIKEERRAISAGLINIMLNHVEEGTRGVFMSGYLPKN